MSQIPKKPLIGDDTSSIKNRNVNTNGNSNTTKKSDSAKIERIKALRETQKWKDYYTRTYPRDVNGSPRKLNKESEKRFREKIDRMVSAPSVDPSDPGKNFDEYLKAMREGF